MYCCSNCFSDSFLQNHIKAVSSKDGKCSFCKSNNVKLINPKDLYDKFEPLLDLYTPDSKGEKLNVLLQSDWNVFTFNQIRQQNELLKLISDNELGLDIKYKPKYELEQKDIMQWELFREELKHNNRFFPKGAMTVEQIEPFAGFIGVKIDVSTKFYRARINTSDQEFCKKEMLKPPKNIVLNGRANPVGIPYLYIASTPQTAIAEVRPHKGETLTVAEFENSKVLELADLRNPKSTISPFSDIELDIIYKNMPFLTLLGNELSKPIIPRTTNLEYLSSQYLSEIFKHIGFHGIIYKSSVSDGNNYVIFDDSKFKILNTQQYITTDVKTVADKTV